MDKFQFYFRKKITAGILNSLQSNIEAAIERELAKRSLFGVASGAGYTVSAGVGFALSIDSGGADPLVGFTRSGRYITLGVNPYVTGDLAGEFTMPSAGNEKWLTIFAKFVVVESQPEVDGLFATVNFLQSESFAIEVVEGVEAGYGTAVKPAIAGPANPDRIYLCDILVLDTDPDFSVSTIEKDSTRVEADPLAQVAERVLLAGDQFGSTSTLATIGGAAGLEFSDIKGSNEDLEAAILAALAAGASGADRLALQSDIAAGPGQLIAAYAYATAGSAVSPNAQDPWFTFQWPVGTVYLDIAVSTVIGQAGAVEAGLSSNFILTVVDGALTGAIAFANSAVAGSGSAYNALILGAGDASLDGEGYLKYKGGTINLGARTFQLKTGPGAANWATGLRIAAFG